jgi:hypothetical protein
VHTSPTGLGRLDAFDQERRGLFDGLSVPHTPTATILAAVGLLLYYCGVRALEEGTGIPGTGHCRLIAGMLGNVSVHGGALGSWLADLGGWANAATSYTLATWVLFWGWNAVTWAFFAGAVCRIAAVKLAREEVIDFKDALRFAATKFLPNLLSIVFVLVFAAFFLLFCNGTLAGWIGRIPYLGDLALGVFFPLVLLSTFLAVFVSALGLLGFNLSAAAIATESSDTFDGVSRAWNYVLARPWQVLLTLSAIFMYLTLVVFFGQAFLRVSVKSLAIGGWGLGNKPRVVDVSDMSDPERKKSKVPAGMQFVLVPGKGDFLYNRVIGKKYRPTEISEGEKEIKFNQGLEYAIQRYREHTGTLPADLRGLISAPAGVKAWHGPYIDVTELPKDRWGQNFTYQLAPKASAGWEVRSPGADKKLNTPDDLGLIALEREFGPHGPALNVYPFLEGTLEAEARLIGMWVGLARLLLFGYVIAYFFSAQTMVYFLLRKDVEGDDYTEVTLDDELDDLEDDIQFAGAPIKSPPAPKKPLPTATPPAKAEEPKAEEPKAEEPKAEEPKAEEPKAEEPKAEEPKAEEPKAEEPKEGDSEDGDSKDGDSKDGDSKDEGDE